MTLNQLKALFASIGSAHYFIKTTEFGTVPEKIEANTEASYYPAFYQVIDGTTTLTNTVERTFTLIVCDLVYPDLSNLDEVHSDTEQTLNDIIKILRQESDYYTLLDAQLTPFKDRYGDAVAGWEATVVIETLYNSGFCDIPSDTYGYPGITGPNGIPIPPAFDCESLNDCSVIQGIQDTLVELQDEIDNLELYTFDNGLTLTAGNVQLGGPLIQNTSITGNFGIELGSVADPLSTFNVNSASSLSLINDVGGGLVSTFSQSPFSTIISQGGYGGFVSSFVINGSSIFINSTDSAFAGLQESTDFSANYVGTSLVNKDYVDGLVASITAQNGLTNNAGTIELGGSLIQNTLIDGVNSYNFELDNLVNFNLNNSGTMSINTIDSGGTRQALSEHYVLGGFTGQSWLAKNGIIENQLIHTTVQFAVTYDSFARIPFSVDRNNPNGEGILKTLPTYVYTTNVDALNGIVGVNSTGELFNTGITAATLTGFVPYTGATTNVNLGAFTITATSIIKSGGLSTQFLKADGSIDSSTYLTTSSASSTYVPYTGATSTVNLGAQLLYAPSIYGGTSGSSSLNLFASTVATTGFIVMNSHVSHISNMYLRWASNSAVANSRQWLLNNDSGAFGDFGLYRSVNNSTVATTPTMYFDKDGNATFTPGVVATGAIVGWQFTAAANTNQTAGANIANFKINGSNKQYATGALPLQYFNHFTANTISFVGSSTATNVYNGFFETTIAGTNATITNNYALGTDGAIRFNVGAGALMLDSIPTFGAAFHPALFILPTATAKSSTNWSLWTDSQNTYLNAPSTRLEFRVGSSMISQWGSSTMTFSPLLANTGVVTPFTFTLPNSLNQTASTETIGMNMISGTVQHATGTLALQRNYLFRGRTHSFVGASTVTEAFNVYIEEPIAGTNATVTNNYALGIAGRLNIIRTTEQMRISYNSSNYLTTQVFSDGSTLYAGSGSGAGLLEVSVSKNGTVQWRITNVNAGGNANSNLTLSSNSTNGSISKLGDSYTTSGLNIAQRLVISNDRSMVLNVASTYDIIFGLNNTETWRISATNQSITNTVGVGTAQIHLKAGTATASSAPLKFTAGTNLTTPENGAFEFDGTNLYFTTGGVRKTVVLV